MVEYTAKAQYIAIVIRLRYDYDEQESLANAKVSARQQCVYEDP